jgi:hypothetical protein
MLVCLLYLLHIVTMLTFDTMCDTALPLGTIVVFFIYCKKNSFYSIQSLFSDF